MMASMKQLGLGTVSVLAAVILSLPAHAGVTDWRVQIKLDVGAYNDYENRFGVDDTADIQYDLLDQEEPPFPMEPAVALYTNHSEWPVNPGKYTTDIVPALVPAGTATSAIWTFYAIAMGAPLGDQDAVLTWPTVSAIPADYTVVLNDVQADIETNMRKAAQYTYDTGSADPIHGTTAREFELIVTVDSPAPRSHVTALPTLTDQAEIDLAWEPDFTEPVISTYTVHVFDEGATTPAWAPIPELTDTTATTGTYTGQDGHTYRFRSVGSTADSTVETELPDEGDAATTVDTTDPVAEMTSPTDLTAQAGELSVQGTASDTHLAYWRLAFAPADSEWAPAAEFTEIETGDASITASELGTWDTAGRNGNHLIRLTAEDAAGHVTTANVRVNLLNTPPVVQNCDSHNLAKAQDDDEVYRPGTTIRITIAEKSNRTGLTGKITITDGTSALPTPVFDAIMQEGAVA